MAGRRGRMRETDAVAAPILEPITELPRRKLILRILPRVVVAAVVVWIVYFGVLPRIADMQDVGELLGSLTWDDLTGLLVLAGVSLLVRPFGIMASTPGRLGYWQGMTENQTSTAICNIVPGGGAAALVVNHNQYQSWGFSTDAFSLMLVVSGIWNNFIKLGMPVVAVAILALTGEVRGGLVVAALLGVAVLLAMIGLFTRMLRSEEVTYRIGALAERVVSRLRRLVRRRPVHGWADGAVQTRARGLDLVRRRWMALTVSLLAPNLIDFFILLLCLRALGVTAGQVGWQDVLVAYSVSKLLTVIPITPGGIGILELGLVGILVGAGGPEEQVVAATLLFRGLTFLPAFPMGAVLGARWHFWNRDRKRRLAAQ